MKILHLFIALIIFQTYAFSQSVSYENYIKSLAFYNQNQIDSALIYLNKDITEGNETEKCRFLLGMCYLEKADYNNAILHFQVSSKLKNDFASYKIAECYAQLNQEYKATEYLKVYLKIKDKLLKSEIKTNPRFKTIENSKAWISLWKQEHYNSYENQLDEAKYLMSTGNTANAFYILDRLIIEDNYRYRALAMRAELHSLTGNCKLAAQDFLKASVINKKHSEYKIQAADCFLKDKKYKKALSIYSEIKENQPYNVEILKNKALSELHLNEPDQAENSILEYLLYYRNDSEALNIAGDILFQKADFTGALEKYNTCIKNNPDNYIFFIDRGDTYLQTEMYENAVYDYAMALDLNPNTAEIYYKKGIANLTINLQESCNDFKIAGSMNYNKAYDYIIKYCE